MEILVSGRSYSNNIHLWMHFQIAYDDENMQRVAELIKQQQQQQQENIIFPLK